MRCIRVVSWWLLILFAPGLVFGGTITLKAGDGVTEVGVHIDVDIDVTALDLGGIAGVDGVTLNFGAKDPGLEVGAFTPGDLLAGWLDVTSRPPFPDEGWSYVNLVAGDITGIGNLGTLEVWSDAEGVYSLAFDVTTPGVATEVAGGGQTFALTASPGTIEVVPEPATIFLIGAGLMVLRWRRPFGPARGLGN